MLASQVNGVDVDRSLLDPQYTWNPHHMEPKQNCKLSGELSMALCVGIVSPGNKKGRVREVSTGPVTKAIPVTQPVSLVKTRRPKYFSLKTIFSVRCEIL